ncbi:MDR family MFS transporter [Chthonobacter albigriseus]|uniref:MDR family MFS transporter n=1 Tax=Chthonobacter albigriseus TaxID=1683161 RepID=UPI0015EE9173|nr:MDR family MFS transporter [Chthonobacter albigriseus]
MTTPPTAVQVTDDDRRSIVIGALLCMFLAALDQTIVAPALPTIGATLGDPAWLSWVISAYFLTATAVTPLYGKLADLRGRRPVLFAAVGIFLVGSVICAVAPSMGVLIAGRAVQGLGGGGLIALAQTIIADVVAPRERSRYIAFISGVWAAASLAGPVVGGVFAEHVHWSLIFWINLPLGAIALVLSERALRKLPTIRREHALDWLGALLVVCATVALMLAMTWGGVRYAWTSLEIVGLVLAAAALFTAFAFHLLRVEEPLLPPRVLRNPVIAAASTSLFFSMTAGIGLSVFIPVYFELVQGMGPAQAGAALVVYMASTVVGANLTGRYMGRAEHYKIAAVGGSALAMLGLLVLAVVVPSASVWTVQTLIAVIGIGLGSQYPVTTVSVQNAAEQRDLGVATAALSFLRSLGSVIGVALLGAILIGLGVVDSIGEASGPLRHDPAAAAAAAEAFRWVFGACAVTQLVATGFMMLMEERPLRSGRTAPPPVTE